MFNGLIKHFAKVQSFDGKRLCVACDLSAELGDSIALNGACLSVTEVFSGGFCVEMSSESAAVLPLENYTSGKVLHAESAMRFGDKVDGHLVQGHVDGVGRIVRVEKRESGTDFFVELPCCVLPFVAKKGSICVDGVSLTVSEITNELMRLSIIPLTLATTLFGGYEVGRRVAVESDLFARYTARILGFGGRGEFGELAKFETTEKLDWQKSDFYSLMY